MGSCGRYEGGICTEEGEGVSIVKGRERRGVRVHTRTIEERVHPTLEVTSDCTSVFRREEGWQEEDGTGLQIFR